MHVRGTMVDLQRIRNDIFALGLMALAVFVGLSLFSYSPADPPSTIAFPPRAVPGNLCGTAGAALAHHLYTAFGLGAWCVLLAIVAHDVRLFSRGEQPSTLLRLCGSCVLLVSLCAGLQSLVPWIGNAPPVGSGGYVGAWSTVLLTGHFSAAGVWILISAAFLSGLLISSEGMIVSFLPGSISRATLFATRVRAGGRRGQQSRSATADDEYSNTALGEHDVAPDRDDEPAEDPMTLTIPHRDGGVRVNPPASGRSSRDRIAEQLDARANAVPDPSFELPETGLLEDAEEFPYELLAKKARVAAAVLEKTFQEFGLNVRVVEIDTGPVITQFELELEPGLRLSKVTALADDLAIALRAPSVRVVASIPGKNTVGVEVPNEKQVMVRLRELIESCPHEFDGKHIPLYLGKDVSGHPLVVDMTKMPHLLIAGRTGTGKSVCLNTLILSILMSRTPDQVRMLLIDPKMVELSPYRRVPHLMHPVITDMKKAEAVLGWAVDKMEERYDLLARCGVRHLDGYNKLDHGDILDRIGVDPNSDEARAIPERMPYIVIVADEMADMMMSSGKDVEGHIIRLAQKSRAVGIHLVLATQKPTVDVITGLIKSNLPARISFQVASRMDSRVVLDESGADRLLGNGDMLYLAPGTSNLSRAQGTYVSDDEINNVIDFYSDNEPQYSEELAQLSSGSGSKSEGESQRSHDDLYEDAIDVVTREGRGSVSLLQRCLGIGYGRAARLIDYMAEDGIVGEYNGSQAREVIYTPQQWQDIKAQREAEVLV